jgi:ferredoxin-NADP reductase
VSNLDPTHVIPFLAAGALQSGMALILMPTPTGFAVMLTQPEPMTDDEIERGAEASAIAVVDVKGLDVLALSYQLGLATRRLANYIASEHGDQFTPEQQATMRGLEPDTSANGGSAFAHCGPVDLEHEISPELEALELASERYLLEQETGAND